jgi:hypothetical protein
MLRDFAGALLCSIGCGAGGSGREGCSFSGAGGSGLYAGGIDCRRVVSLIYASACACAAVCG